MHFHRHRHYQVVAGTKIAIDHHHILVAIMIQIVDQQHRLTYYHDLHILQDLAHLEKIMIHEKQIERVKKVHKYYLTLA